MKVSTLLDHIDSGHMALPEFQRGYVWSRTQVRGLLDSLYRGHPVGSLLVWATGADEAAVRGDQAPAPGVVKLLLDGQQRITSLYGIIRGRPPEFFDGNEEAFLNLYFHLEDETFEFYGPVKMRQDSRWISVTDLMQNGLGDQLNRISADPELAPRLNDYLNRLNAIHQIKDREFHVEEVTGGDKTVDVVVDIFNRVNSGGTKLSKGDLALAKICAEWSDARTEMRKRLKKWQDAGFDFKLDWLLRNINTIMTGEALFTALKGVSNEDFKAGLDSAEHHIDYFLNLISSRLGLDHDRVLGSPYSFPLLTRYLDQRGGKLTDPAEQDRLLFWYIHTMLWGRYAGSTESILNQDLAAIEENEGALDRLVALLRRQRGDLRLHPNDFLGWSRGARFYPLLYMLTRVFGARDWDSSVELHKNLLGKLAGLQLHHIFPKAKLYEASYERSDVNALANFTFLTQETNLRISDLDPATYLAEIAERDPALLESHWIPMDPELWRIDRYLDFLSERRTLLAEGGNEFLEGLYHGDIPTVAEAVSADGEVLSERAHVPGSIDSDHELHQLVELGQWVSSLGLPAGSIEYELVDEETGEPLAVLDLAWPDGLQPGLSQPVAVLLDETTETESAANAAGFRFFTNVDSFQSHVTREILGGGEEALPTDQ